MEKTMKTGKVGTLGEESRFTYGGVEWIVLDVRPYMSLCIAADVLKDDEGNVRYIPFDKNNKNDFTIASSRDFLNDEFMEEMVAAGADKEAFATITIDLTSDDGLDHYGTDEVKIAHITCDMYRHFRKLIPNASDDYWTCTPFSTESSGHSFSVRYVSTSGALNSYSACYGSDGVRPLCALKSDILVSFDEEQIKERKPSFGEMLARGIADGMARVWGATRKNADTDDLSDADEDTKKKILENATALEERDNERHRAEAVDMMKHIAAAFDIPAMIDEVPPIEVVKAKTKELFGLYRAIVEAGFNEAQAWEIFMARMKK